MTRAGTKQEAQSRVSPNPEISLEPETPSEPDLGKSEERNPFGGLNEETTERLIEEPYREDDLIKGIIEARMTSARKLPSKWIKKGIKLALRDLKVRNNRVYYKA